MSDLFTVVIAVSHPQAPRPGTPIKTFVLPKGDFSGEVLKEFHAAAEKGGCKIQTWTIKASGVEDVKWELSHINRTVLD